MREASVRTETGALARRCSNLNLRSCPGAWCMWLSAKVVFAQQRSRKDTTMAEASMALSELVEKGAQDEVVRELLATQRRS